MEKSLAVQWLDSELLMLVAQVQSLLWELRCRKPCSMYKAIPKKKKKKIKNANFKNWKLGTPLKMIDKNKAALRLRLS